MKYKSYKDYVRHQCEKLGKKEGIIREHDRAYEEIVFGRYSDVSGKKVLCLAARLGGEVRAFKRLGADAIGIDLNPGRGNKDVIKGDFHDLKFKDKSFDISFCNSLDHVLYPDKFFMEVKRVTREMFVLEVVPTKAEGHAVTDTHEVEQRIKKHFSIKEKFTSENNTTCLSGAVHIYLLT